MSAVAHGLDLSSLTRAERRVLASGGLLFLNGIVPWWYRTSTPNGSFSYNAGLTGWGTAAVLAGALAAVTVLARASVWPGPAPRWDGTLYTTLGAAALLTLLVQLSRGHANWIGIYIAVLLALALTAAGLHRRSERRSGWT